MKIYMIICLIAVLLLKQSNHQLFWITGLNIPHFARSLASEEFIPQDSNPAPVTENQNVENIELMPFPSNEESQSNPSDDKTEKDARDESDPDSSEDKIRVDVINNDRIIAIPIQVPVVSKEPDSSKPIDSPIEPDILSTKPNIETPTSTVVSNGLSDIEITSEESLSEDAHVPQVAIPASNLVRNTTAEVEKSKPTLPPQQEEEPIPSFLEWTQLQQKKLQDLHTGGSGGHMNSHNGGTGAAGPSSGSGQHQSQQNGNNVVNVSTGTGAAAKKETDSSSATKNFASPDCGAKVIQSNPGSQNPNGVLSSSHDEYMLNKCGIPIWFVIELCEPLKIEKVSLGNLELFSSSPKEFELGISDRFPAREWNKLGPFPLPDSRSIHPLTLPATNSSTFGKFLKVNILSHHGTEHYCPLSVVKVNGKSEYEVLESETTHAEDEEGSNKGEGSLYEEELDDSEIGKTNEKSVFGSATDAVINIVKKAAQVLAKTESTPGSDLRGNDSTNYTIGLKSGCQTMTHCLPSVDPQAIEEINDLLSCNSSNLFPFLLRNLLWCGWEGCHSFFSRSSIGLPWQLEGFYSSLFGGPNVLTALCHYLHPLKKPCDVYVGNNTIIGVADVQTKESNYANLSLNVDTDTAVVNTSSESEIVRATTSPPVIPDEQPPPPPIQTQTPPTDFVTEAPIEVPQTPAPPVTENQVDDTQNQQTFQASNSQQQQKESVFVRLSNRIKTLERNQSLTASYLEELSRRFKKQNEDNHNLNEITKKQLNETQEKSKYMENLLKTELQSVRRNLEDMRERLFTVQIQRSLLILICLVQFTLFVCICLWIKRRLHKLEKSISYAKELQEQPKQPSLGHLATLSGRKRANSDVTIGSVTAKVKKIKKKKKSIMPNADSGPGCTFNFKATTSNSTDIIDIVPRKENVNPLRPSISSNGNTTASTRPGTLKYDIKSDVNNSQNSFGRFGILASPGPSEVFKQSSGSFSAPENSLSTLNSNAIPSTNAGNNSASSSSSTISSGVQVLVSSSSNGNNTNKKTKKTSFKSLMPRIFDR